jgi:hypothetical protein
MATCGFTRDYIWQYAGFKGLHLVTRKFLRGCIGQNVDQQRNIFGYRIIMKCIYLVIRLIIPFIKNLINAFNYLDFNATLKPSIKLK